MNNNYFHLQDDYNVLVAPASVPLILAEVDRVFDYHFEKDSRK